MRQTRVTEHPGDDGRRSVFVVEVLVEAEKKGAHETHTWVAQYDTYDREAAALRARDFSVGVTDIPGTLRSDDYGSEQVVRVWHGPSRDTLLRVLNEAHHVASCGHTHDCCGCICGSSWQVLSLHETEPYGETFAVVRSSWTRNL